MTAQGSGLKAQAITLDQVTKKYGETVAVRELTLSVQAGEMFGLIGPDGAGKTTTIRLICGLLKADAGLVRVLERDPVKQHREVTQSVGYLSQRFSLYGDLTIDENIAFFAEIHGLRMSDARIRERRNRLLDLTQLTPFRARLADQLSGGMKQKLALACTLVHEPKIILLDEPTEGLMPRMVSLIRDIVQRLRQDGVAILLVEQNVPLTLEATSRCYIMEKGAVQYHAPSAELKHNHAVIRQYLGV